MSHQPGGSNVLEAVLAAVSRSARQRLDPVVVFDLDHTLLDPTPRTLSVLRHLAEKHHARVPGLLDRLLQLSPDQVPFDHSDTLRLLGVDEEPHFTRLRQELRALFFSSEYLDRDVPHPGARAFVEDCRGAGAIVVYLTGRDHGGMHAGTVASLIAHAFPLDQPDVHLLMKPDQATRDLEFKSSTCQQLRGYGELVAFFDNEPENVNSFKEAFPSCIAVLVTTKHSKNPPPPAPGVERVANFLRPAC